MILCCQKCGGMMYCHGRSSRSCGIMVEFDYCGDQMGWRLAAGQEADDAMMEEREHEVSPHLVLTKILVSTSKI